MRFKIIYILFLIAAIFYANLRLPLGLTPRHIMAVIMFITCIAEERTLYLDKWFGIYILFIFGFVLSANMTGYVENLSRYLLGFYFVAFVGYWSTIILCRKYDGSQLFANTFVILGMINVFVTIGQFYNIPISSNIPQILNIKVDVSSLDAFEEGEEAYGVNLPGLMNSPVYNGYLIGVVGVLSLNYIKNGLKLIKLVPWGLSVLASFMVQQRAPFYILLFLSIIVFFKTIRMSKSRYRVFLALLLFVTIPVIIEWLFSSLIGGNSRFNIGTESNGRIRIYRNTIKFIENNFMWGGHSKLRNEYFSAPHNLFLNSWVDGGFLGFIAIVWLTLKQCVKIIRSITNPKVNMNYVYMICAFSFLGFTMNSLFHNASIVSGDLIVWLLWGMIIGGEKKANMIN